MFGADAGADQTSSEEKSFQAAKFNEIVEVLIAAGYYRARVAGLSSFDKAVGGLCWCITLSGEAVDVDILFQENATIGARIELCEAIVEALRQMGCPHPLQAHQIQGGSTGQSDWPALFPVVAWLVKRSHEVRERTSAQLRRFARLRFGQRGYGPLLARAADPPADRGAEAFGAAARSARVRRRFRRLRAMHRRAGEESRVHSTLLEYGETMQSRYGLAGAPGPADPPLASAGGEGARPAPPDDFERRMARAAREAEEEERRRLAAEAAEQEELLRHMSATRGGAGGSSVAGGRVASMLRSEGGASRALRDYEGASAAARAQLEAGAAGRTAIESRLSSAARRSAALEAQVLEARGREERGRAALRERERRNEALRRELRAAAAAEGRSEAERRALAELRELLRERAAMRAREEEFRRRCAVEAAAGEEREGGGEAEEAWRRTEAKYARLKQLIAERHQSIARSARRIDEVPTRTELIQYERRFVELEAQAARRREELRKYQGLRGVLESKRGYLEAQLKVVQGIAADFDAAMRGRQPARDAFLAGFDAAVEAVRGRQAQQERRLEERRGRVEALAEERRGLVDRERAYFAAIKALQEECDRNEALEARAAEGRGEAP